MTQGGSIAIVGSMIRTESITSLYRGLVPTVSVLHILKVLHVFANTEMDFA